MGLMHCKEFKLLGDPEIATIPVNDDGSSLVDLAESFPELTIDFSRSFMQSKAPSISFARAEVGERLVLAQAHLPPGIKLLIKECFRPLWIQREYWSSYSASLRKRYPALSDEQIAIECSKYVAPTNVAPHSTGGAVDLTLIDEDGNWLEMGTEFNADPQSCEDATYFRAPKISAVAKANREILKRAMEAAGFVNYPTEWWHWSFGDKYWAHVTGATHALYGSIEDFEYGSIRTREICTSL